MELGGYQNPVRVGQYAFTWFEGNPNLTFAISIVKPCLGRAQNVYTLENMSMSPEKWWKTIRLLFEMVPFQGTFVNFFGEVTIFHCLHRRAIPTPSLPDQVDRLAVAGDLLASAVAGDQVAGDDFGKYSGKMNREMMRNDEFLKGCVAVDVF